MKRPEFRPFAREDFPDAPWIEKLIRPLNTVLGAVATGLGNSLTLGENLNAEIRTLDITTRDEWVAPTFLGSWVAYGDPFAAPAYRCAGGRVFLRGVVKSGTVNTAAFQLPAGIRPAKRRSFTTTSSGTFAFVDVDPSGDVIAAAGGQGSNAFVALDGVSFDAGASLPNPAFPVKFTTKVKGKVAGVWILRCVELDGRNELPVNDSLSAGWAQDGSQIQLTSVAGLSGGKTYRLSLAVLGGS